MIAWKAWALHYFVRSTSITECICKFTYMSLFHMAVYCWWRIIPLWSEVSWNFLQINKMQRFQFGKFHIFAPVFHDHISNTRISRAHAYCQLLFFFVWGVYVFSHEVFVFKQMTIKLCQLCWFYAFRGDSFYTWLCLHVWLNCKMQLSIGEQRIWSKRVEKRFQKCTASTNAIQRILCVCSHIYVM